MRGVNVERLHAHFPEREPRAVQGRALEEVASSARAGGVFIEMPTGEGKTPIGMSALRAVEGRGPRFYVTPTKAQVDQIARRYPDHVCTVTGRADHPCLYYEGRGVAGITAQDSPCYMLQCAHRVNQETGQTVEEGAEPCPYFQQKFAARRGAQEGRIILCTTAFFLRNRLSVSGWRDDDPSLVVFDEVHRLASVARALFEYTVSDYYIRRALKVLRDFDRRQSVILIRFIQTFRRIARKRPARAPGLLTNEEIERLVVILEELDVSAIEEKVRAGVAAGRIDPLTQRRELKELENLARNIPRFVRSLQYAVEGEERHALNLVVAFYYRQDDPEIQGTRRRARYFLTIKPYFVGGLLRKAAGQSVIGYSATIGDPDILRFETGFRQPFWAAEGSSFSSKHTRIYMPTDTRSLSRKVRRRDDVRNALRLIADTAATFAARGKRSLVVVVSNDEREQFLRIVERRHPTLGVVSYNTNGITARGAAAAFAEGQGSVLVGTASQYAEGIDLPGGIAPVIFFLRPGYQRPDDPMTQFEERRFSQSRCWALWNWRVMIEALQVRGRNIRSTRDVGVCFFVSQQFRRFLRNAMPEWLRPAYVGDKTMEACVQDAMTLLGS